MTRPQLRDMAGALSESQTRKAIIYPRRQHRSRSGYSADFLSAAIVSALTDGNIQQTFDDDDSIDNQSARPLVEWYPRGSIIVLVGGPFSHDVVNYYMNRAVGHREQALVQCTTYHHGTRMRFQHREEILADALVADLSKGEHDYAVVQCLEDGEKRSILMITGFTWRGTWAGALWFRYRALREGKCSADLLKWVDDNQNGLVELSEVVKVREL